MKRRIFAVLVALMLAAMPLAMAETTFRDVKARSISVSSLTDVLICRPVDSDYYMLMKPDGTPLTDAIYTEIREASSYPMFQVSVTSVDGVHDEGLLDLEGHVIIPPIYADIQVYSDRWQAGIKLTASNADDKDYTFTNYSTDAKSFYRIDTVDFYFDGQMVGTLNRSEFGDSYCTAHGAYICVPDRSRKYTYYNNRMEKSPMNVEYSGEYDSVYKNGKTTWYHQGSGQVAFAPGCTLTPDEVDKAFQYDRGVVYGLQGQELFRPAQNYDNIHDFEGNYARVSMNRYYGLIDSQGNELIAPTYDGLSYNFDGSTGYIGAELDGKFGFLDLHGNVTCPFTYSKEIVNDRGTFATITNLDGTTIVLSAAVGELPEHYQEVNFPSYNGSMVFIATNTSGLTGLVDIYGNVQVPYTDINTYRLEANKAGTVAVADLGDRNYRIYTLDIPQPATGSEPAPAEDDGAWTCANGHAGQTGKFCTECGAPRPSSTCPACGYQFPEGSAPKFCPECGAAQG